MGYYAYVVSAVSVSLCSQTNKIILQQSQARLARDQEHLRRAAKEAADASAAAALDCSDDEELAQALDMHSLIVTPHDLPPPQTAEQVIEEIDEIMQQSSASEMTGSSEYTLDSAGEGGGYCSPVKGYGGPFSLLNLHKDPEIEAKVREAASLASNEEKLRELPYHKLLSLQSEMESLIQVYNEALVSELALRDELEYEKELKNTFISLLLSIQNKRRHYVMERRKKGPARFLASAAQAVQGGLSGGGGNTGASPQNDPATGNASGKNGRYPQVSKPRQQSQQ